MQRAALPILALCLLACSDDATAKAPIAPSIEALYGAPGETQLTPYPSDRYTVADAATPTGLRVRLGPGDTIDPLVLAYPATAALLGEMDGFSTSGGVVVSFSGPIDVRGIVIDETAEPPVLDPPRDSAAYKGADAPMILIDVDPASPERGVARGLLPKWWAQAKDGYYLTDEYTLVAQPDVPLRPSTRYLFVVTDRLKAASGGAVVRSKDMAALIDGGTSNEYATEVRDALVELEASLGVGRERVVLATAFTTATVHDGVLAMAKAARSAPLPAITSDWSIETPLQEDGRARFRAVLDAPEYRKPSPDGKWDTSAGAPIEQARVGLEVFLAFSDATTSGPRPVIFFAHGLGGTKDGCWGTAERLRDLNAAVIAIDSPEHGSRSATPDNALAATFGFFGIDSGGGGFDIGRARDNFRQMASDQLELVRLVSSLGSLDLLPVGAPDGVPDLDVSRFAYIGHSFGSVQGPLVFALAPEIEQAVWNVGGDGLMTLLRDSGTFGVLVDALAPPGTPDGALGRFFAVTQAIVDPGDPLNYAQFGALVATPGVPGWRPRDMLLQEVIKDSIVPNSTSEALARAAGLVHVDPIVPITGLATAAAPLTGNLPGGATGAIAQFDRIEGGKLATHGELIFSPEAQAQYVGFFASGLAAGHATVPPAYGP